MAYLYRLIALVGLVFLLTPSAQASFPATVTNPETCTVAPCYAYQTLNHSTGAVLATFDTFALACADRTAFYQQGGSCVAQSANYWMYVLPGGYTYYTIIKSVSASPGTPTYSCPSGSTLSGSVCTCNSGLTQSGNTCIAVNNCSSLAGKLDGYYNGPGSTGPKHLCVTSPGSGDSAQPGCVVTGTAEISVGDRTTGLMTWGAAMSFTGAKCLPDPNASTDASGGSGTGTPGTSAGTGSGTSCRPGQLPGTVNGVTVCADAGSSDPVKTTTTGGDN